MGVGPAGGGGAFATENAEMALALYRSNAVQWEAMVSRGEYLYSRTQAVAADAVHSQHRAYNNFCNSLADDYSDYHDGSLDQSNDYKDYDDHPHWYGPGGEGSDRDGYWEDEGVYVHND